MDLSRKYHSAEIWDSIQLAESTFGAKAIILVTYALSQQVETTERWEAIHNVNEILRRIAKEKRSTETTERKESFIREPKAAVLILEFANLTNQMIWYNARNLGMNLRDPSLFSGSVGWEIMDNTTELLHRVNPKMHTASSCGANVQLATSQLRTWVDYTWWSALVHRNYWC